MPDEWLHGPPGVFKWGRIISHWGHLRALRGEDRIASGWDLELAEMRQKWGLWRKQKSRRKAAPRWKSMKEVVAETGRGRQGRLRRSVRAPCPPLWAAQALWSTEAKTRLPHSPQWWACKPHLSSVSEFDLVHKHACVWAHVFRECTLGY